MWCAQKALSLVAGNGYTEDYPTARLFRDAMVLSVWEGPEQIQALELMRMIAGKEPGDKVFLEKLSEIAAEIAAAGLTAEKDNLEFLAEDMRGSLEELRAKPEQFECVADEFLHKMADILAYALLCKEAAWELENGVERTKVLVCDYYYQSIWNQQISPPFTPHPLFEQFDSLVGSYLITT